MRKLRLASALALLIVSLTALAWGLWPASSQPHVLSLTPSEITPPGLMLAAPTSATSEPRKLTLQYPSWIRVGDSYVMRLTLDAASLTNAAPTAGVGGNSTIGPSVQLANADETHAVIAEARLELEGAEVLPATAVSEPLLPGESVAFRWSVRTPETGSYRGTAWLVLVFVDKASGVHQRVAISAQPVQIPATSLLGLGGAAARVLGGLGAILAGLLGTPFVPAILKRFQSPPRANS